MEKQTADGGLVDEVVARARRVEYMDAVLYFVDGKEMARLREAMRADPEGFWREGNLLNPLRPATRYELYSKRQYRLVTDNEKVAAVLAKRLSIWERKERKTLRSLIDGARPDEAEAARWEAELERRIAAARDAVLEILADPSRWELMDTNYPRAREYPFAYIHFDGKEKGGSKLLRERVPNFLWYAPGGKAEESAVARRLKRMENLFGDIYVKAKEKGDAQ